MSTVAHPRNIANYRPYRGLPALAGIATMEQASRPGMDIDTCVRRLKRYHYVFKRLHEIFNARLAAEPIMELKNGFALHAYLSSEHVLALRDRVAEMREPPLHLDAVPHPAMELLFDEIRAAPTTEELLGGIYEIALPALHEALQQHMAETNPLADAPSVRLCRFAVLEIADMVAFGEKCLAILLSAEKRRSIQPWLALLSECFTSAGGLNGSGEERDSLPAPQHSARPFVYDPIPRRDQRFTDLWNQGVNAEAFIHDAAMPAPPKILMLYFKRLREVDVPEMMSRVIYETRGKEWKYYRDMTRQMWDEARHAMMGEVGFVTLGIDWTQARIAHSWSYRLNTELTPLQAHAVLYAIEQGLMAKTGKRYEWEIGKQSGDPLITTFQDFDWADEVLHARIGRSCFIPQIGNREQAVAYCDTVFSTIRSSWLEAQEKGLSRHENWWPSIYLQACKTWNVSPDPEVLAYNTSYEPKRTDLQGVAQMREAFVIERIAMQWNNRVSVNAVMRFCVSPRRPIW